LSVYARFLYPHKFLPQSKKQEVYSIDIFNAVIRMDDKGRFQFKLSRFVVRQLQQRAWRSTTR